MPFGAASGTFYDLPLLDPETLLQECTRLGIPTEPFRTRANSWKWAAGPTPGRGYVLLLRQHLDQLSFDAPGPLVFFDADATVTFPALIPLRAIAVTPGADPTDPNAAYILELTDKRYLAKQSALAVRAYNVVRPECLGLAGEPTAKECYRQTLDGLSTGGSTGTLWTWERMVADLWASCNYLGAFPVLPKTPHGHPYNFLFHGVSAYDALNTVLERLGFALNYDPITDLFNVVDQGDPLSAVGLTNTLTKWQERLIYQNAALESEGAKLPATIRVMFHGRNWFYAKDDTVPSTPDQWTTKPAYWVDVPTPGRTGGFGDTYAMVWDDLPAIYDEQGTLANAAQLQARAAERVANYAQNVLLGTRMLHRVYSGLCGGEFRTSGVLSGVMVKFLARGDGRGDGLKTEILRRAKVMEDIDRDWRMADGSEVAESLAPPDVARPTVPFDRFVWGTLLESVKPHGRTRAAVLRGQHGGGSDPELLWNDSGIAVLEVYDFFGLTMDAGARVILIWHWQTQTWVIMSTVPGGAAESKWVRLEERDGKTYTGYEVDLNDPRGCSMKRKKDAKPLKIEDVNCASHNSQGPINPLIIQIFKKPAPDASITTIPPGAPLGPLTVSISDPFGSIDSDTLPVGACCTADFCKLSWEFECISPATWMGAGTVCDPNPCVDRVEWIMDMNHANEEDSERAVFSP